MHPEYLEIERCRICGSSQLIEVLSLGEQCLTGVFPRSPGERVTKGPVDLVWCADCSLLQIKQSYALSEMYGENYGYRSGLNESMVRHLQQKVKSLEALAQPNTNDLVVDIGSNDSTTLKAYAGSYRKVGIDPTGTKFQKYYRDDTQLIPEFFSAQKFKDRFHDEKAQIITSIAMFYDLECPMDFVRDIEECLAPEGIWHFEQSYMPSMLRTNSYDTICHEHLEFYSLKVVKSLLENCGLRIIDVQLNGINGGSFAVTACKAKAGRASNEAALNELLQQEEEMGLGTLKPYREFAEAVFKHREELTSLMESLVADGKKVIGYGASTKGNVLLQFCDLTSKQIPFIAEVNDDKFGAFTPGTLIPIVSEADAKAMKPDYFFVLPWHFRDTILEREKDYLAQGGKLIFPLPKIEIVG